VPKSKPGSQVSSSAWESLPNVVGFCSRAAGGAHGNHRSSQRMSRCQRPRLCRSRSFERGQFHSRGRSGPSQRGRMATKFGSSPSVKVTMTRHSGSPVRTARLTLSGESHIYVLGRRCRTVLPRESFRHHERYLSAPNQGRTRHDVRESPLSGCLTSHRRWQDQDRPRRVAPITCTCLAPRRSIDQKDTAMRFRSSTKRGRPGEAHHVPHCRRPTAAADGAMRSDWVRGLETWQGKGS
jgi:hypothetical protein